MSFMIIPVICMAVTAALCIRPALEHDQNLPMSVTGKARK